MIPPRYVTIDGYPVAVAGLETSCVANLGYDQLRGVTSHAALGRLPWTSTLGSVVTVHDASDEVTWQGRLSAPPKVEADQTIRLAAQGHAYQGAKSVRRLPIKVSSVLGWTVGNTSPLDMPQTASAQPAIAYVVGSGHLVQNTWDLTFSSATDASVAYYAPGAEIRRLTWSDIAWTGSPTVSVYGARGPGINASKVLLQTYTSDPGAVDLPIPANDFDTIIVRIQYSGATTGDMSMTDPIVWGAGQTEVAGVLKSHDVIRGIAGMMDWDASGVEDVGDIEFSSFDGAGDVAGGMNEACVPDDFRWLLLEDRGAGPVVDFGDWSRTWEVSGASGATWTLDPLEKYTKVVVQYLDDLGKARAITAEVDDPELFRVTNELQTVAGGLQSVDNPGTLPEQMAENILDLATSERWRGTISAAQVREAGTGLTDLYRVRAGDLVRITDFSPTDGAVTLRIAEVSQTDAGITMGIEAPVYAAGSLSTSTAGTSPGTFVQIADSYAPAGAPGSTVPTGGFVTGGGYGPPTVGKPPSPPGW